MFIAMTRALYGLLGLACALVACGSSDTATTAPSSGPPCGTDPLACAAGTTCWIAAPGTTYQCLASGPGKKADPCTNVVGVPSCGDALTCYEVPGYDVCTPLCDDKHPCAGGGHCVLVKVATSVETIHACLPDKTSGDAGSDGG